MRKVVFLIILVPLIASCVNYLRDSNYEVSGIVPEFNTNVPDGLIINEPEKKNMIDKKIKHLQEMNKLFWGTYDNKQRVKLIKSFIKICNYIEKYFPGLEELNIDLLKYQKEGISLLENTNYYGDYLHLISKTIYILNEGHGYIYTTKQLSDDSYNSRMYPIFTTATFPESQIGANCILTEDKKLVVANVGLKNPYQLEKGDIILGFNGIRWEEWIPALLDSGLPFYSTPGGNREAIENNLIRSAVANTNLFEKMNIKKYGTDIIETYIISPIKNEDIKESLDIFSVPKGVERRSDFIWSGIIKDTNIGYIRIDEVEEEAFYINSQNTNYSKLFEEIVVSMAKCDGIILDNRINRGGDPELLLNGFKYILNEEVDNPFIANIKIRDKSNPKDHSSFRNLVELRALKDEEKHYFGKPVYLICGSQTSSTGDLLTYFCSQRDEIQVIGTDNSGSLSGVLRKENIIDNGMDIIFFSLGDFGVFDSSGKTLIRQSFIETSIWFNRDDLANGVDTPLQYAIGKIQSSNLVN